MNRMTIFSMTRAVARLACLAIMLVAAMCASLGAVMAQSTKAPRDAELERAKTLLAEGKELYERGKYEQALPLLQQPLEVKLYERALEIQQKALGATHPDVAVTLNDLAVAHLEHRDKDAAPKALEQALTIQERCSTRTIPISLVP